MFVNRFFHGDMEICLHWVTVKREMKSLQRYMLAILTCSDS